MAIASRPVKRRLSQWAVSLAVAVARQYRHPLALHDLATSLARQGFVVVAVVHPGDNDRDHSRLGSLSNLYGRPLQISEAISTALLDPLLAPISMPGKWA